MSQQGETIGVYILTGGDRSTSLEIGDGASGIYFTDDPVEIGDCVNDTFDVLLRQSATVRLYCEQFVPDFFCASCRDARVNIYVGDKCVFAGFIEPQTYSQGYNELLDEVELNCVDVLTALQYSKYKEIGSAGVEYSAVKAGAGQVTLKDLVTGLLGTASSGLAISRGATAHLYYDGSKGLSASDATYWSVWTGIAIEELLFLGDEEDDVWQQDEVLEAVLRYLDLHIWQDGFDFYVFSWSTLKAGGGHSWVNILGENTDVKQTDGSTVEITRKNVADTGTKISIGEVYNQLLLTAERESVESLVESPLEEDSLVSPFGGKQLYMTEYIGHNCEATTDFIQGKGTTNKDCVRYDWYFQVMQSTTWRLNYDGVNAITGLFPTESGQYVRQWMLARYLRNHSCVPCIFRLGSVKKEAATDDDSPTSSVSMSTYLYISVNGNETDTDAGAEPTGDTIQGHAPLMEYVGGTSGGVFSPSDDGTTNYLVFSGKMLLQPVVYESTSTGSASRDNDYAGIMKSGLASSRAAATRPTYNKEGTDAYEALFGIPNMVGSEKWEDDGKFYARRFYAYMTPASQEEEVGFQHTSGIQPWTDDKGRKGYKYKYCQFNETTDKFKKLPVLECELIIGDKRLVEVGMDAMGNSTFEWVKVGSEPTVTDDDGNTYTLTTFSLGVNPKIGDYIIGDEFDLQNTIDYTMGIDAEGTAIPIKMSDKVSGKVTLRVLGLVNSTWNDITFRHHSFWRHSKWSSGLHSVLAHVENVIIKDFECKVYSDNGLASTDADGDLVYMSDTDETYVNKKDDITFKICSALTSAECRELGVTNAVSLSTPLSVSSGTGLLKIYDTAQGVEAKAEQLYVDAYYQECHVPRVEMTQSLIDADGSVSRFDHYRHAAMGKDFYVVGMGRNLIEGTVTLSLKEV